jgi:hypothetical protein
MSEQTYLILGARPCLEVCSVLDPRCGDKVRSQSAGILRSHVLARALGRKSEIIISPSHQTCAFPHSLTRHVHFPILPVKTHVLGVEFEMLTVSAA